jgi:hypothetical protein
MNKCTFMIERIEGTVAVLETEEGETFEFPAAYLPEECGEGDYVDFVIAVNQDAADAAGESLDDLRSQLNMQDD